MPKTEAQIIIAELFKRKTTSTMLGAMMGISYRTIERWRDGKTEPNLSEIEKLQRILQEKKK